jgi:hypothetical protein
MKYRKLTSTGDYMFGELGQEFYINSPEAVAQAVMTRLLLWKGEWFVDIQDGTPYQTEVLGMHTKSTYDLAIQARVLGTQGVVKITDYYSILNTVTRELQVAVTIDTIYGPIKIEETL